MKDCEETSRISQERDIYTRVERGWMIRTFEIDETSET